MEFTQAMEKVSSLERFGSMPGLERIQLLLDKMGNPERKCRYIHVAGTNGKGSICTMLAEILRQSGYKVGLFTSPYIIEFCDRISINGEMIPKQTVADIIDEIFPLIEEMQSQELPITEFECVTALGFEYFSRQNCDIVVLETGLGGRFDSTNVISSPIASVITSISLDHTAVLGDSLELIAGEKAGIIKHGGTTVFCPQQSEVNDVIISTAIRRCNEIITVDMEQCKVTGSTIEGSKFVYRDKEYEISLSGVHQVKNACTALEALTPLKAAGFNITDTAVKQGLKKAFIPARLELLSREPLIILDGAHNPSGLESLSKSLREYLGDKRIFCIMSMLKDKAVGEAMVHLEGMFEKVYLVEIDSPRAMSADELKRIADKYFKETEICLDKNTAVEKAITQAKASGGAALVCGSLYLASELRNIILNTLK